MGELIFNGESYVPVVYERAKERDWVKPNEWVDLTDILMADEKESDSKVACLVDNTDESFTFELFNNEGLTAIKFNDGTMYEGAGTYTHTFSAENNIVVGYEIQRWYILYYNGELINREFKRSHNLPNSVLWISVKGEIKFNESGTNNSTTTLSPFAHCPQLLKIEADLEDGITQLSTSAIMVFRNSRKLQSIDIKELINTSISVSSGNGAYNNSNFLNINKLPKQITSNIPESSTSFNWSFSDIGYVNLLKLNSSNITNINVNGAITNVNNIDLTESQPFRFNIIANHSNINNLKTILNIDFSRNLSTAFLSETNLTLKNTSIINITVKPNTLNISFKFETTNLSTESQWEMVNAFVDRTGQDSLVLTIPLELYQKMTAEMLNTLSDKNISISTY